MVRGEREGAPAWGGFAAESTGARQTPAIWANKSHLSQLSQTTFSATKEFMCKTDSSKLFQSNGSEREVSSKGLRALVQFF